jgi:hypothetical protein
MSFGDDNPDFMEWRANVKSSGRALLMLFLFSDVGPDDAPTKVRKGSHATIARELLPYGDAGATLRQLSANGYASTEDCQVELATDAADGVYLCHPFLVHAAPLHRGDGHLSKTEIVGDACEIVTQDVRRHVGYAECATL